MHRVPIDPEAVRADRFWRRVRKTPECWEWEGSRNNNGYGTLRVEGRTVTAHRVSYALENGAVDPAREVDHICRNKGCVRPLHLREVTRAENRQNLGGAYRRNKSGRRGVTWRTRDSQWAAQMRHNGKNRALGQFPPYEIHVADYVVRRERMKTFTHNELDREEMTPWQGHTPG